MASLPWRPALLAAACALACAAAPAPDVPAEGAVRRLTGEAAQVRGRYGAVLAAGLKDPYSISAAELELVGSMARSPGVASVVYLNCFGQVRWAEEPEFLTLPLEAYQKQAGVSLGAAAEALKSASPLVRKVPDAPVYEVAIPILADDAVAGLLDLWVRRDGLRGLLAEREEPLPAKPAAKPKPAPRPAPESEKREGRQAYLDGLIHYQRGEYAQAREDWEAARRLDPGDPDVAAALARLKKILAEPLAAAEERPQPAKPAFDRSRSRSDDQRAAQQYYLSGIIYYDKGDHARARQAWATALGLDPDNADAAAGLARLDRRLPAEGAKSCVSLFQAGRLEDAAEACEACLESDPRSAACTATLKLLRGPRTP